jgi:hypothetical protein
MSHAILDRLMKQVLRDKRGETEKSIRAEFAKRCKKDERLQVALFNYWFMNSEDIIECLRKPKKPRPTLAERAVAKRERDAAVSAMAQQITRRFNDLYVRREN